MSNADDLRIFVYDHLAAKGLPPTLSQIGKHFGLTRSAALEELIALKIGKTILVHPESGEIWMAGPFASTSTDYEVVASGQTYWANCAWDMLGIPLILNTAAQIHAKCTDCGSPMTIDCDPSHPPAADTVVHFLVPARHWYEDIGFT